MGDKEDYLTLYRVFFENFAATVNPEDQLPVNIAGYTITEAELPGEVLYWITQYLTEKQCPQALMTPLRRIVLDEVRIASKKQPIEFGYKSDESVYIALRLMQAVTARVIDVCLRYLDNSKLDTLPPPPPPAQRDLKTVSCATKNSRRAMEDRHVEIGNLEALFGIETREPTSFYAVYDGHAGPAAATYCAAHLHQYLVESSRFTTDLQLAMRDAFLRTDAEFIKKSNQERANGGSTAVVVCVRARRLIAAWAGDSLALLAKRMRLMQLVRPHKPGRKDEKERIESSGGTVIFWGTWRVNGQLAVSRAIGDAQYKPYVTAQPEIVMVDLDGDEDFVVVACDGLWDFVSEDDVALTVYRQLAADPDDLKAVTKRLIVQAKRQGSADNISIIVVFLKDPRHIAADNRPPMELGLENTLAMAPPFPLETEACKREVDAPAAAADVEGSECVDADTDADAEAGDNAVDNSDSDSEDLGPETAVDADDIDADARNQEPEPPTPPADKVGDRHVDGALLDNVAESGEDSEDEWNYFKGEGKQEKQNPSPDHEEPPLSHTPCQENSASESCSSDMNTSPLNPDAPVFVPGSVVGMDKLLAESPRKPLPMDDIDLPDVAQFETGAVVRPADLLDMDNSDQHNGHHNVSINEAIKEHLNGNDKCNMDSLGFGFNVDIEPDKVKDMSLIEDFERIQKDTTDFCNVQVFQTHTETNPFAVEGDDELFERLKNKERDPMSMSFYQEKDDDTCERLSKNDSHIDLNAVQPLPDSDDEDLEEIVACENIIDTEKENVNPHQYTDLYENKRNINEPDNDIVLNESTDIVTNNTCSFPEEGNFVDYNIINSDNIHFPSIEFGISNNSQNIVLQTDTPESHKLLFEQIPEIPDGKSSELGFSNDDIHDALESDKDARSITPQEKSEEVTIEFKDTSIHQSQFEVQVEHMTVEKVCSNEHLDNKETDVILEPENFVNIENAISPLPNDEEQIIQEAKTPEHTQDMQENVIVEIHQPLENLENTASDIEEVEDTPKIEIDRDLLTPEAAVIIDEEYISKSPVPSDSPLPLHSPLPVELSLPSESPEPEAIPVVDFPLSSQSPTMNEVIDSSESHDHITSEVVNETPEIVEPSITSDFTPPDDVLQPSESPLPIESPPVESQLAMDSVLDVDLCEPKQSPVPIETHDITKLQSPVPITSTEAANESPIDEIEVDISESLLEDPLEADELSIHTGHRTHSPLPAEVPLPRESPLPGESPMPIESPVPVESLLRTESPLPSQSPLPTQSPIPAESLFPTESLLPTQSPIPTESSLPAESPLPTESPLPIESSLPIESPRPTESPLPTESFPTHSLLLAKSLAPAETVIATESPLPVTSPIPTESPIPPRSPISAGADNTRENNDNITKSPLPTEIATHVEVTISTEKVETFVPAMSPIPNKSLFLDDSCLMADSTFQTEPQPMPNSHLPTEDVLPTYVSQTTESPIPTENLVTEASIAVESTFQAESPVPVETIHSTELPITKDTFVVEPPLSSESPLPTESPLPSDLTEVPVGEPAEERVTKGEFSVDMLMATVPSISDTTLIETSVCTIPESVGLLEPIMHSEDFLRPDSAEEALPCSTTGGPAPDVVPDKRSDITHQTNVELVTDIDIGIPESHAQEICVPITSEIRLDDAVQQSVSTTPPPTPAVEPEMAPLTDALSAAEAGTPISAAVAAGAAAAAATVAAAVASKAKTTGSAKKSPTTPTAKSDTRTPKSATTARTPVAAAATKKKTETSRLAPTASRTTSTKTPTTSKPSTPATKPATSATKSTSPLVKPTTPSTKSTTPSIKSTTSATKPSMPLSKPTVAATKTAVPAPKTTATGLKPTTVPAKTSQTSRPAAAKPTTQPAKTAARDVPVAKAPTTARTTLSKPAPKPAPTTGPPRAAAPAKAKPKPTEKPLMNGDVKEVKVAATRAAPRPGAAAAPGRPAPRAAPKPAAPAPPKSGGTKPAPRAPLDKQSKDLANKRLTTKAAPPRTAPAKAVPAKNAVTKIIPKKAVDSPKKEQIVKDSLPNGGTEELVKPPPSPPIADNALLPDVIA